MVLTQNFSGDIKGYTESHSPDNQGSKTKMVVDSDLFMTY